VRANAAAALPPLPDAAMEKIAAVYEHIAPHVHHRW